MEEVVSHDLFSVMRAQQNTKQLQASEIIHYMLTHSYLASLMLLQLLRLYLCNKQSLIQPCYFLCQNAICEIPFGTVFVHEDDVRKYGEGSGIDCRMI